MANARQFMAARTAAWAKSGSGVPTARDYAQDGLVFQLDGIENAGYGVHDSNPSYWLDLAGGFHLLPNSASKMPQCNDDSFGPFRDDSGAELGYFRHSSAPPGVDEMIGTNVGSIECVWRDVNVTVNNGRLYNVFENNYIQFNTTGSFGLSWGLSNAYKVSIGKRNSCIVSDGSGVSWYSDGELASSATGGLSATSSAFWVGYYLQAKICALRIYNRALTSAEISHNYAIDKVRFGLP